jgi:hypothetical protein
MHKRNRDSNITLKEITKSPKIKGARYQLTGLIFETCSLFKCLGLLSLLCAHEFQGALLLRCISEDDPQEMGRK